MDGYQFGAGITPGLQLNPLERLNDLQTFQTYSSFELVNFAIGISTDRDGLVIFNLTDVEDPQLMRIVAARSDGCLSCTAEEISSSETCNLNVSTNAVTNNVACGSGSNAKFLINKPTSVSHPHRP